MTNINCTKNCLYQEDGKCCYDCVESQNNSQNAAIDTECLYFRENIKIKQNKA